MTNFWLCGKRNFSFLGLGGERQSGLVPAEAPGSGHTTDHSVAQTGVEVRIVLPCCFSLDAVSCHLHMEAHSNTELP